MHVYPQESKSAESTHIFLKSSPSLQEQTHTDTEQVAAEIKGRVEKDDLPEDPVYLCSLGDNQTPNKDGNERRKFLEASSSSSFSSSYFSRHAAGKSTRKERTRSPNSSSISLSFLACSSSSPLQRALEEMARVAASTASSSAAASKGGAKRGAQSTGSQRAQLPPAATCWRAVASSMATVIRS